MTVSNADFRAGPYEGNGAATTFAFGFKIFKDSDIEVVHTDADGVDTVLTLDADYAVTGAGSDDGGSITYPISGDPLPSGEKLTLILDLETTQGVDLQNRGGFYPQVIEDALDKVTLLIKQLQEVADRALKLPASADVSINKILEDFAASRYLAVNGAGTGLQFVDAEPGETTALRQDIEQGNTAISQWQNPKTAFYASSATTVTIAGDVTAEYHPGRRIKAVGSMGAIYGTITKSVYTTSTAVTSAWDSGGLESGALTMWVGTVSARHPSIPYVRVTPQMFGAVGDGATDDTDAFTAFAAAPGSKHIPSGTYVLSKQITFNRPTDLTFGTVTLNFGVAATAGDFPDHACVYLYGGDLTALPGLGTNPSEGDSTLAFSLSPALQEGNVFLIYNDTDSSFSGWRTYYRAGEFCRVYSVSGGAVGIYGGLYAGYTAAGAAAYTLAGVTMRLTGANLRIVAPSGLNNVCGLKAKRLVDSRIDNVSGEHSGDAGIVLEQCFDFEGHGLCPRQNENSGLGSYYGLVIANCQKVRVEGDFYARNHAVSLGGYDEVGAVPNRDIQCRGTFTNSVGSGAGVGAAEAHGNSEYYSFEGTFNGGITVGGDRGRFNGTVFVPFDKDGLAVYFAELLGWGFDLSGLRIVAHGDPYASVARGTIDLGGNGTAASSNTTRGGVLNLSNIKVKAADSTRAIMIRNNGSAPSEPIVIDLRGTEFYALGAAAVGLYMDAGSGDNFTRLLLGDFYLKGDPAYSVGNVDAINGWRAAGSVSIPTTTSISVSDAAVTFPRRAPKAPKIVVSVSSGAIGAIYPTGLPRSITATGFTARLATPDSSNFSAATSATLYYIASLEE